jgi:hypothetical protein
VEGHPRNSLTPDGLFPSVSPSGFHLPGPGRNCIVTSPSAAPAREYYKYPRPPQA